jgi:hypothetical protein
MKKFKLITGICWAFAGLLLILILFPALNGWSEAVSRLPFMKINPNYTGGEVVTTYTEKNCTLNIHRPVFDGLLGERQTGFVQIDWKGELPEIISDTVDYNRDGKADFFLEINRKDEKTNFKSFSTLAKNIRISTAASYGWSARIGLAKEK